MKPTERDRVAMAGSPDFLGTVIKAGEQVSEIKWDNVHTRGPTQWLSNEIIIPAKTQ